MLHGASQVKKAETQNNLSFALHYVAPGTKQRPEGKPNDPDETKGSRGGGITGSNTQAETHGGPTDDV